MRNFVSRLYLVVIAVLGVFSAFIRLYQLIKYTDVQTGLVTSNYKLSYIIYASFGVAAVFSLLFALSRRKDNAALHLKGKIVLKRIMLLLLAVCFYDFLYHCLSLYDYITGSEHIDITYALVVGTAALTSLFCSAYLSIIVRHAGGVRSNINKLSVFNFVFVIWAFVRLIIIMLRIVDFKEDTQSVCEFIFLGILICFFFTLIYVLDNDDKRVSGVFYFFCAMSFFSALSISLSRIVAVFTGTFDLIPKPPFSSLTYLFFGIGVISLAFCCENTEKSGA